jgi:hypothetical protein
VGRKCVRRELRDLIFRMVADNPTWGAPRIHGGRKTLGFDISERSGCGGCEKHQEVLSQQGDARPFSAIIVEPSP